MVSFSCCCASSLLCFSRRFFLGAGTGAAIQHSATRLEKKCQRFYMPSAPRKAWVVSPQSNVPSSVLVCPNRVKKSALFLLHNTGLKTGKNLNSDATVFAFFLLRCMREIQCFVPLTSDASSELNDIGELSPNMCCEMVEVMAFSTTLCARKRRSFRTGKSCFAAMGRVILLVLRVVLGDIISTSRWNLIFFLNCLLHMGKFPTRQKIKSRPVNSLSIGCCHGRRDDAGSSFTAITEETTR